MARLLLPRTIAVVGATDRPGRSARVLWRNVSAGATGAVYAVNPNRTSIDGRRHARVWPTVADVPDDIWLAVDRGPGGGARRRRSTTASRRTVRGAVVVTAVDGTDLDIAALVAHANQHGVRVIGPSSMGVASSRPEIGLQASLVPVQLPPGRSPSRSSRARSGRRSCAGSSSSALGLSWFVSLGDRSDVSGNDLLQFWDDDEHDHRDRDVHRDARQPAALRPHRPACVADAPDRHRPHRRRRHRPVGRRAVPALRPDRGAHGHGDARHAARAGDPAGAARPQRGGDLQLAQPADPRRDGARRPPD